MPQAVEDKRENKRFSLPWLSLYYRKERLFSSKNNYAEEQCPIIDISRGGLRFLTLKPININAKLTLKILIPNEEDPLIIKGVVRWRSVSPTRSFKHQIGIKFYPFIKKKGQNDPRYLKKIIELEQLFSNLKDEESFWVPS